MTTVVDVQPEPDLHDRRTVARERRAARQSQSLIELLERRPELAGTCPWASLAVEGLRWSV